MRFGRGDDPEADALEELAQMGRKSRFDARLPEGKRSGFVISINVEPETAETEEAEELEEDLEPMM